MSTWEGTFGTNYMMRNPLTPEGMDDLYLKRFGISRTQMNVDALEGISRDSMVLEVGCSTGQQMRVLAHLGFSALTGIDVNPDAIAYAKRLSPSLAFMVGDASHLPAYQYDLVYTSGLLIHVHPDELGSVMDAMYAASSRYIWGFEYFNTDLMRMEYREDVGMWKGDFAQMFLDRFPDLKLKSKVVYPYMENPVLTDCMYLLEKR